MKSIRYWLRDYFVFSKTELNAFFVIAILILLTHLSPYCIRFFFNTTAIEKKDQKAMLQVISRLDSIEQVTRQRQIQTFDPNQLNKEEWLHLGVKEYIAENITRYLQKGGHFYHKEDILKIYGFPPEIFQQIEPYMSITIKKKASHKTRKTNDAFRKKDTTRINLNKANAKELQKINGIGPAFSDRIIKYRTLLGGFANIRQLYEVYGLDSILIQKMEKKCLIDPSLVQKINMNTCTFKVLLKHPYINYDLAGKIMNCITYESNLQNEETMRHCVGDSIYHKLEPYITYQ